MDLTFISWSTARQSEDRLTDRALTETWPRQVLHVLAQEGWMGMAANTSVSLNVRLSCHEAGTHSTTWYLACPVPRVAFSTIVSLNAMQRPSSHGPGVTSALEQARDPTHCHWGTLKAQHSMSFMSCYVQSVPCICSSWFFFFRSLLSWKSNYCQYDLASLFQAPYKAMMKESLFCWNSIELPSSNPWWHACGFLFEGAGEKNKKNILNLKSWDQKQATSLQIKRPFFPSHTENQSSPGQHDKLCKHRRIWFSAFRCLRPLHHPRRRLSHSTEFYLVVSPFSPQPDFLVCHQFIVLLASWPLYDPWYRSKIITVLQYAHTVNVSCTQ